MKKKTKINYEEVKKLKSFCGVELKGNETFNELLEIEKEQEKKKLIKERLSVRLRGAIIIYTRIKAQQTENIVQNVYKL